MRRTTIFFVAAIAGPIAACHQSAPRREVANAQDQATHPAAEGRWREYRNDRFDYVIAVPPGFSADPAPQNNDGRIFRSGDAALRVAGSHNVLGARFADQIAQMRDDQTDVALLSQTPMTWRARGRSGDGWVVDMLLARVGDDKRIAAWFSYPGNASEQLAQLADRALGSLKLIGRIGPVRFRYAPQRYSTTDVMMQTPPAYDRELRAVKLIPVRRAAQLGEVGCRYGLSGKTERCSAPKEAGLAFAIDDRSIAAVRAAFTDDAIRPRTLAGVTGFSVTQQAEGEGVRYSFLPVGQKTLVIERLWRNGGNSSSYNRVLKSLKLDG